jgi:hypothetical protein
LENIFLQGLIFYPWVHQSGTADWCRPFV